MRPGDLEACHVDDWDAARCWRLFRLPILFLLDAQELYDAGRVFQIQVQVLTHPDFQRGTGPLDAFD